MSGRDIRLRATIAGPFSAPTVEYTATSPFVAFDNTGFEQARLSGRATLVGDRKTIPVTFTARRVTGAGVEAEDILRNLRVEGPLFLQNNRLFSDRLAVRSDKRSEEHTSELQSLMRISYAVFCLKKKNKRNNHNR